MKNNPHDKKPHTGIKPATAIHRCDSSCEGREEDRKNSNRRCQFLYTSFSHEQPSAVGGLRQTRSSSGDPCLENANKSGADVGQCLKLKGVYPNICQHATQTLISFAYSMSPENKTSFDVNVLFCRVMW